MTNLNLLVRVIPLLAIIPLIAACFVAFYNIQSTQIAMGAQINSSTYLYLFEAKTVTFLPNGPALIPNAQTYDLKNVIGDKADTFTAMLALLVVLILVCVIQFFIYGLSNKYIYQAIGLLILLLALVLIVMIGRMGDELHYSYDTGAILCFLFLSIIFLKEALTNKILLTIVKKAIHD
jgi:hypothetical protein